MIVASTSSQCHCVECPPNVTASSGNIEAKTNTGGVTSASLSAITYGSSQLRRRWQWCVCHIQSDTVLCHKAFENKPQPDQYIIAGIQNWIQIS